MATGSWRPSEKTMSDAPIMTVRTYLFEIGASGDDLVNEILNGKDVIFAEVLLNHGVVAQRDALLVDFSISPLVDQLLD